MSSRSSLVVPIPPAVLILHPRAPSPSMFPFVMTIILTQNSYPSDLTAKDEQKKQGAKFEKTKFLARIPYRSERNPVEFIFVITIPPTCSFCFCFLFLILSVVSVSFLTAPVSVRLGPAAPLSVALPSSPHWHPGAVLCCNCLVSLRLAPTHAASRPLTVRPLDHCAIRCRCRCTAPPLCRQTSQPPHPPSSHIGWAQSACAPVMMQSHRHAQMRR